MPPDQTRVFRAARESAEASQRHLREARLRVRSARKQFVGGTFVGAVGMASWWTVGEHLDRSGEECASAYRQLLEALDKAEHAVDDAMRAAGRMGDAVR